MGIFDKLKQKKDNTQPTREEYENHITEVKNIINNMDTGLGETANETFNKEINQALEDIATEQYGTDEEKRQLAVRKKQEQQGKKHYDDLKSKYQKAKRMRDKNSIRIFNQVIDEAENYPKLIIASYHGLMDTYMHIKQFDNAIDAANKCIEFKKVHGQDCSYELHRIEVINRYKNG